MRQPRYKRYSVRISNFLTNNPAAFWRHLQKSGHMISMIEDSEAEIVDKLYIATIFNSYSTSVFTTKDMTSRSSHNAH